MTFGTTLVFTGRQIVTSQKNWFFSNTDIINSKFLLFATDPEEWDGLVMRLAQGVFKYVQIFSPKIAKADH